VRTGKVKAREEYLKILNTVDPDILYAALKKDISSRSYKELYYMPGPLSWLRNEEYKNHIEEVSEDAYSYGKDFA